MTTETGTIPEALQHHAFEAEDELGTAEDLIEAVYALFETANAPLTRRRRGAILQVLGNAKLAIEEVHERWRNIDAIVKGEVDESAGDATGAAS